MQKRQGVTLSKCPSYILYNYLVFYSRLTKSASIIYKSLILDKFEL